MADERKKLHIGTWNVTVDGISDAEGFAVLCCTDSKETDPRFEAVDCSVSTRVFRFEWNGCTYFHKEFCYSNVFKQLKVLNRGEHLCRIALDLQAADFETPDVVCIARSGMRVFVVSAEAKADDSVYDLFMENSQTKGLDLDRFRYLFGQEIGRLHTAGFIHGDLRWGNVLVRDALTEQPAFIYIDNDRTRWYSNIPARERIKNLVQINYPGSLLDHPESDWETMWEGYVSTNADVRSDAGAWRRKVDAQNEKRVKAWWKKPRNRELLEQRKQERGTE